MNRKLFLRLEEARWVIDRWRRAYHHHRLRGAIDYPTLAVYAAGCVLEADG